MKQVQQSMMIFILSVMFSVVSAADITESEVMMLINVIDEAIADKDVEKISRVFSDNVSLTMKVNMMGGSETLSMTKQEYLLMLKEGWSSSTNYEYSRTEIKINLSGSSAVVEANIVESMTMSVQGTDLSMSGETKERVTIELINNVPLITDLYADSDMNVSPL